MLWGCDLHIMNHFMYFVVALNRLLLQIKKNYTDLSSMDCICNSVPSHVHPRVLLNQANVLRICRRHHAFNSLTLTPRCTRSMSQYIHLLNNFISFKEHILKQSARTIHINYDYINLLFICHSELLVLHINKLLFNTQIKLDTFSFT